MQLYLHLCVDVELPALVAEGALLPRFRQEHARLPCVFAHIPLEGWNLCRETKMLQQVSEPLCPWNRGGPGHGCQFLRIDPLGEFREDCHHSIESVSMTCISHKVDRRRFRRRNEQCPPRRVEGLNRHIRETLARYEGDAHRSALDRPAVPRDEDLELLRALMGRAVILCGRQKARVVEVETLHQRRDKLVGGKAAKRTSDTARWRQDR